MNYSSWALHGLQHMGEITRLTADIYRFGTGNKSMLGLCSKSFRQRKGIGGEKGRRWVVAAVRSVGGGHWSANDIFTGLQSSPPPVPLDGLYLSSDVWSGSCRDCHHN
ncbi:hypothetical protein VE01_10836 [Pseudogymnoascus verrucosus]|uniref:Uncharacterized protein n=1 Tax=Pseudogymnoascus verrucosus TaxID=342668 RepID=A0A2P6FH26_9PEZI|nr:uncharacterized protein VE01_10836 [Pseudogymnoascus verrucosus]PQM43940.1 hypothetical protein VE01_10836 [Pseudogymnoascus verrucosus]